ncbi:MAG: GNAT family N-acetyltransferase [Bacteroidota bacterium]
MAPMLQDNPTNKRYEYKVDGGTAFIEYIKTQDKIYLTHTEVPKGLEGKGIGKTIVQQALEDVKAKGLTLIPLCPFVALFIKRNPEYRALVLKGINIA